MSEVEDLKETLEHAFKENSGRAVVFMSDEGDGSITALYVKGTQADGEAFTCHVDGRVLNPVMIASVAAGLGTNAEALKGPRFHDLIANAVGASISSEKPLPGITMMAYSTGPVMAKSRAFAAGRKIEAVKSISIKQVRNIAWRFRKSTEPKREPREKREDTLF